MAIAPPRCGWIGRLAGIAATGVETFMYSKGDLCGHQGVRRKAAATWRVQLAALRYVPLFIQLMWQTHRGYTAAMAVLRLLRAFTPIATLWVGKLIIDAVVAMRQASPDFSRLWELVALEIVIVLVGEVLARASGLVESLLGELFSNYISERLMEHAATLDLYHFEDPAFYDRLERARRQTTNRVGLLAQLLTMGQDVLTLVSLGAALGVYSPWLLLVLAVAILPSFLGETHFAALEYALFSRWTPERRQLDYLRYVGASDETAKEVQTFGLASWLVGRYRRLSERFYEENKRLSIRKGSISIALSIIGTLGYYAAYIMILVRAVHGLITLGSLTFLAASFARSRDLIAAPAARREQYRPAVSVPQRPLRLLRNAAVDPLAPRRASGAPAGTPGIRLRRCRFPLPRQRRLGGAARALPPVPQRAPRLCWRERCREDDAHQAARTAVRSYRRAHPARWGRSARLRPAVGTPSHWRHFPGLRAL